MKTDYLKELGLSEEQIAAIMKENGKDIDNVKTKYQDYDDLKTQLSDANTTIQGFQDMDIDGIKKSVEDYKSKAENAEKDKNAFIHKSKLQSYVKGLNLRDDVYENHLVSVLLDKGLQFDGETLIGGDDVVKPFRESHPDAFKRTTPAPHVVDHTPGPAGNTVTKEAFGKMGYAERRTLKQENPEIYQSLKE